jgi:hypothetical protein
MLQKQIAKIIVYYMNARLVCGILPCVDWHEAAPANIEEVQLLAVVAIVPKTYLPTGATTQAVTPAKYVPASHDATSQCAVPNDIDDTHAEHELDPA